MEDRQRRIDGLRRLDEAMIAVTAGELSPEVAGSRVSPMADAVTAYAGAGVLLARGDALGVDGGGRRRCGRS